jgi:1-acyl-sn-glycerol-3-phosphate acyltransferase
MRRWGWRFEGAFPALPRFVVVVAPHTSNWDFFVGVTAKFALGLKAVWIGKDSLFRWPVGPLLRRIGGVPVDRSAPNAVVRTMVDEFARHEAMVFVLAPEGTRKRVERWRSGYWHIAHEARVPIIPVGFDFARRCIVIGPPLHTGDDLAADEQRLRDFARGIAPRRPALYVP